MSSLRGSRRGRRIIGGGVTRLQPPNVVNQQSPNKRKTKPGPRERITPVGAASRRAALELELKQLETDSEEDSSTESNEIEQPSEWVDVPMQDQEDATIQDENGGIITEVIDAFDSEEALIFEHQIKERKIRRTVPDCATFQLYDNWKKLLDLVQEALTFYWRSSKENSSTAGSLPPQEPCRSAACTQKVRPILCLFWDRKPCPLHSCYIS